MKYSLNNCHWQCDARCITPCNRKPDRYTFEPGEATEVAINKMT